MLRKPDTTRYPSVASAPRGVATARRIAPHRAQTPRDVRGTESRKSRSAPRVAPGVGDERRVTHSPRRAGEPRDASREAFRRQGEEGEPSRPDIDVGRVRADVAIHTRGLGAQPPLLRTTSSSPDGADALRRKHPAAALGSHPSPPRPGSSDATDTEVPTRPRRDHLATNPPIHGRAVNPTTTMLPPPQRGARARRDFRQRCRRPEIHRGGPRAPRPNRERPSPGTRPATGSGRKRPSPRVGEPHGTPRSRPPSRGTHRSERRPTMTGLQAPLPPRDWTGDPASTHEEPSP